MHILNSLSVTSFEEYKECESLLEMSDDDTYGFIFIPQIFVSDIYGRYISVNGW